MGTGGEQTLRRSTAWRSVIETETDHKTLSKVHRLQKTVFLIFRRRLDPIFEGNSSKADQGKKSPSIVHHGRRPILHAYPVEWAPITKSQSQSSFRPLPIQPSQQSAESGLAPTECSSKRMKRQPARTIESVQSRQKAKKKHEKKGLVVLRNHSFCFFFLLVAWCWLLNSPSAGPSSNKVSPH